MKIDIYEDAKKIKVKDLPKVIQEELEKRDYQEYVENEEFEEDEYYKDYDLEELRYIKYPEQLPIVISEFLLDGGMEVTTDVEFTHNVKKVGTFDFYATASVFYEKENKDEKAYIMIKIEYRDDINWFLIMEI